ncbi:hypothetical protein MKW92_010789, partial [Papaver armeniacum]
VNTSLKAGEAGYDPFSRRWTRSRNYYDAERYGKEIETRRIGDGDTSFLKATLTFGSGSNVTGGLAATAAALGSGNGRGGSWWIQMHCGSWNQTRCTILI